MNEIRLLPIKLITIPKGGERPSHKSPDLLDGPIQTEGLYPPIAVRRDPAKQGHYLLISGRDRYRVAAKVMKQELIECRVVEDMDDDEAWLATLSEDHCRKNAGNAERLILVSELYKLYAKKYPELIGKRASGKSRWKNREAKADEATLPAGSKRRAMPTGALEPKSKGGGEGPQTFLERASAVTGGSKQVIARDLKFVKWFTEEQLLVLGGADCAQKDMLRILELTKGDAGKRQEIVSRVAKGMNVKKAIKTVCVPARNRVTADSDADDAWFDKECGKFGESLENTDYYKSDAIVYRDILEARTQLRKKVKKLIEKYKEERKDLRVGWLLQLLHTLINLSHPKDWIRCSTCGSKGIMVDSGDKCPNCIGYGFKLKAETRPVDAKA